MPVSAIETKVIGTDGGAVVDRQIAAVVAGGPGLSQHLRLCLGQAHKGFTTDLIADNANTGQGFVGHAFGIRVQLGNGYKKPARWRV
ncbi:hypothetical protein GCM10023333_11720 [Ferrimonas pelagia]|uniref:Uncharacterized protein n=1 Tax=Ferrimonas pelagia TaxID=1177826 RepID=A0ABP9EHP3_9GAMM